MIKEYKKNMPILPVIFSVIVYDEWHELCNYFPHYRFSDDPRDFDGGMMEIDSKFYIAFHNNRKLSHGHVAHECKHLVNSAFRWCGIKLDNDNDEAECYFLTYVVNEVYKHIKI